jgi:hypothetical protein
VKKGNENNPLIPSRSSVSQETGNAPTSLIHEGEAKRLFSDGLSIERGYRVIQCSGLPDDSIVWRLVAFFKTRFARTGLIGEKSYFF